MIFIHDGGFQLRPFFLCNLENRSHRDRLSKNRFQIKFNSKIEYRKFMIFIIFRFLNYICRRPLKNLEVIIE
ncbi:hypothetical protein EHQ76_18460 [Leptospira barantonii]|uniref:Uncharacterized protein n=1 Tax=Leptospira barantonii TaxID=2023184 RepID=A0A5F2AYC8_9LEPT|nr:hypothetical protein EHQ76_18460 [Leptospira barantonii]